MNSTLQQLYMHPKIRALILQAPSVPLGERKDCVFHELRQVFAQLGVGRRSRVCPEGFWESFKDYDGRPMDVKEHQDAYEFVTRLQDSIDQHLRGKDPSFSP